jgi:hypothetical protein
MDERSRPSSRLQPCKYHRSTASSWCFRAAHRHGSSKAPVLYFVFDVMILAGRDVMREPLEARRQLLEKKILPRLSEPVRYAAPLDAPLPVLIESVKAQGLEGLVAKRLDSRYETGLRSGAWQKMRVNLGQEFVIGGYTVGTKTFDALVFGYYESDRLIYAARTRNGFTPVVREQLFKKFRGLEIKECPFVNLPEAKSGRWGAGLTAAKMKDCRWLKPVLVAHRVPGVDGRKSSAPHQVHCPARRQTGTRRYRRSRKRELRLAFERPGRNLIHRNPGLDDGIGFLAMRS